MSRFRIAGVLMLALALLMPRLADTASASGGGVPHVRRGTRSVGLAHQGRLLRGVRAEETRFLRHTPEYARAGRFFGTWELVQLLHRAAYRVSRRLPGAQLSIGELSAPRGGRIPGHRSHQAGRDVDIAFYMTDARGRPFSPWAFAGFDANGVGTGPNQMLRFDDARNWELVAKLVADGDARVQYIFVARHLRARLLAEGRRRRAAPSVLRRAAAVMAQPSTGHPHDNHFHVRIYCAPADRPRCLDEGPRHPWYPGGRR